LLGGLLLTLLARRIGVGLASWAVLLGGGLGTFAAAELIRNHFVSVGASTAVFGALAELAALQAADSESRRRAWIPLGAGLALLGFLGSSKRADFAGHLCGFAAGVALGFLAARLPRLRGRAAQAALAAAAPGAGARLAARSLGHLTAGGKRPLPTGRRSPRGYR
jgi:membrane associated rhomboid family serine protease